VQGRRAPRMIGARVSSMETNFTRRGDFLCVGRQSGPEVDAYCAGDLTVANRIGSVKAVASGGGCLGRVVDVASSMPTALSLAGVRVGSRRARDAGFYRCVVVIVGAGGRAQSRGLGGCVPRGLPICDGGHDACLVVVDHHGMPGTVPRPVLGGFEHLSLAKCRFDAPHGVGAGLGDDTGFVCAARRFRQIRLFDGREFVVGATGDALQVGFEIVGKPTGFGG
jgi:hypothetical protein